MAQEVLEEDLQRVLEYIVEKKPRRLTTAVLVEAIKTLSTYRVSWVRLKLVEMGVLNRDKTVNIEAAEKALKSVRRASRG